MITPASHVATTSATAPARAAVLTPATRRDRATIGACLAPIHARWLAEVRGNLLPACDPRAGFWPRWGAVRYLADRFDRDYGLEGELLDGVIGEVEPRMAGRLTDGRKTLETLRHDLDWIGRRRGTGLATAAIAGAFLQALRRWCAELEQALWSLPLEDATPQTGALLAQLGRISRARDGGLRQPRRVPA